MKYQNRIIQQRIKEQEKEYQIGLPTEYNIESITLSKSGGNDLLRPSVLAEKRRKDKALEEKRIRDMINLGLLK